MPHGHGNNDDGSSGMFFDLGRTASIGGSAPAPLSIVDASETGGQSQITKLFTKSAKHRKQRAAIVSHSSLPST